MKRYLSLLLLLFALSLVAGCAATTPRAPVVYQPGVRLDTLSASVSLSVTRNGKGMGAHGFLLYRRPDSMRIVVLSPFGTTLMEAVVAGERITIEDNSKGVAFSGLLADLPEQGEWDAWRQARWVMDVPAPGSSLRDGSMERVNGMGVTEQVTFENGLVVAKKLPNGDEARYSNYEVVNGVPLAGEVIMSGHSGGRVSIRIDEPEVNAELSPEAFTLHLDGLTLYPLSALQGRD